MRMNRKQKRAAKKANPPSKQVEKDALLAKIFTLANQQMNEGLHAAAAETYKHMLHHSPESAPVYHNFAVCLERLGEDDQAFEAYRLALKYDPKMYASYSNIGSLLHRHQKINGAIQIFEHVISLSPNFASAHHNLGNVYAQTGKLEKAIQCHRKALANDPKNIPAKFELCSLRHRTCDWSGLEKDTSDVLKHLIQNNIHINPFSTLSMGADLADQQLHNQLFAKFLTGEESKVFTSYKTAPFSRYEKTKRRIKIGYLSSDFNQHAVSTLLSELIEKHDRANFEIIAYCHSRDDESATRKRIVSAFDELVPIHEMTDYQAAMRIHDDEVDILVDLKGFTKDARTRIFSYRPAPVQVNYLGYPSTMGADFIDYIIADRFIAPMEHQPYYDEAIVHLPDTYFPNDTKRKISNEVPTREQYDLPEDAFVFCSFNNAYKISEKTFDSWMRILNATENSVLWLFEANPLCKANLQREAIARKVDPNRMIFSPMVPKMEDHLARCRLADLFLDTLPYNAHTTATDALWAGLPILTCTGDAFSGRVATSLLNAVGLPELVTDNLDDYEKIALELANDPAKLKNMKSKLQENITSKPLFDIDKYTKNIELAYENMVHLHSEGKGPTPFAVSDLPDRNLK